MIAIVSSNVRERGAFSALCESCGWPSAECDSIRKLNRMLMQLRPGVILTRYKLSDGYSDDVLGLLDAMGRTGLTRVIVLIDAGTSSASEQRQVALGADVVCRDPVRTDVIRAYLARFRRTPAKAAGARLSGRASSVRFAGASVDLLERTLRHGGKMVALAPREVELIQILFDARGSVVTYDLLYSEILGRRFRGDSSNMRVLLGKLGASFRSVGLAFRPWIEVIPKTGYRYLPAAGN